MKSSGYFYLILKLINVIIAVAKYKLFNHIENVQLKKAGRNIEIIEHKHLNMSENKMFVTSIASCQTSTPFLLFVCLCYGAIYVTTLKYWIETWKRLIFVSQNSLPLEGSLESKIDISTEI